MRQRDAVPAEVRKQIAEQYAKGRTYFAIMKKFKAFKVTTTEIVKARDEFGVKPRRSEGMGRGFAKSIPSNGHAVATDKLGAALRRAGEELNACGVSSVFIDLGAGTYTVHMTSELTGKLA